MTHSDTIPAPALTIPAPAPTEAQAHAYSALFEYFNRTLFEGRLPPVLLNLQRKSRALGFFWPERWQPAGADAADEPERLHEISLNPEHLATRDARDTCSTLVHEMCHLQQHEFGAKKPKKGNYHNREWGDMMRAVGLEPSSTGAPGGKATGTRMTHYIVEGGPFAQAFATMPPEILLPWQSFQDVSKPRRKDRSKLKHTCTGCGANVWGKAGVRVTCGECELPFECEDAEGEEG